MRENTRKNSKRKAPKSLKSYLVMFFAFCWGIPIIILFITVTIFYRNGIITKTETLLEGEINNATEYATARIDEIITIAQKPSYDKDWEYMWLKYENLKKQQDESAEEEKKVNDLYKTMMVSIKASLTSRFNTVSNIKSSAVYLWGEEQVFSYVAKDQMLNSLEKYEEEITPAILNIVREDASNTIVTVINERVFVIRNLYTTSAYTRYGVLAVEVDAAQLLSNNIASLPYDIYLCFNDTHTMVSKNSEAEISEHDILSSLLGNYNNNTSIPLYTTNEGKYMGYLVKEKRDHYNMGVIFIMNRQEIFSELYSLYNLLVFLVILGILICLLGVYFLRIHVTMPINRMVDASKKIKKGEFGTVVNQDYMPNQEFQYLMDSFNGMSKRVKYLFDYAYDENMARKDAKIMALQAQINPHFLNNTLEMMNWQARMSGADNISKMIEALSTVMNYRMNRDQRHTISLSEELKCADAYIYITQMRFGQRLRVEKDIDESLLHVKVPRLVLQPIVENAVIHGVERAKADVITISIHYQENKVFLKVTNTGKSLTEKDIEKISAILEGKSKDIARESGEHTSLGIRNVNERIKLMYGESYGLSVEAQPDSRTTFTITLPYDKEKYKDDSHTREDFENELMVNMEQEK